MLSSNIDHSDSDLELYDKQKPMFIDQHKHEEGVEYSAKEAIHIQPAVSVSED